MDKIRYRFLLIISLMLLIIIMSVACSGQSQQKRAQSGQGVAQPQREGQAELLISAAASLTVVLDEIINAFQEQYGIHIEVNYGSSGMLQKQIQQGAPVDVFISAGSKQMDELLEQQLVEDVKPLLRNSLIAISASKVNVEYHSLDELLTAINSDHIALGQPETVPAGNYAQQALVAEGIWSSWQDRYVYGKDVRQVLSYVEQGNAQIGFVYATDALSSNAVQVVYRVPEELHEPIEYPIAIVATSKQRDIAQQFLSFMQQAEWRDHYEQSGFQVVAQ